MINITPEDLADWYQLRKKFVNGWYMSENDWLELIRLNHIIMDASHNIHNTNMLRKDK